MVVTQHENYRQIFSRIVDSSRSLKFHRRFPPSVKDFVKRLLNPIPALRLGMLNGGMNDLKVRQRAKPVSQPLARLIIVVCAVLKWMHSSG